LRPRSFFTFSQDFSGLVGGERVLVRVDGVEHHEHA